MEKMKVFGKQYLDFTTREGQYVNGVKLHCFKDAPNEYWEGKAYEGFFVSKSNATLYPVADSISIGAEIDVEFNRYGKVDSFQLVQAGK